MAVEALRDITKSSVSAFGGGGAAATFFASVSITPAVQYQAAAAVTDALISSTSKVMCQLAPNADWDADDLTDFEVFATPAAGSVVFTITRPGPIVGTFLILYTIG